MRALVATVGQLARGQTAEDIHAAAYPYSPRARADRDRAWVEANMTRPAFKAGDRVKPSWRALESRRQAMLDYPGDPRRKRWHDQEAARRGTVVGVEAGTAAWGVRVAWDDGGESIGLGYMVELEEGRV